MARSRDRRGRHGSVAAPAPVAASIGAQADDEIIGAFFELIPKLSDEKRAELAKKKKSVRREWTKDDLKTLKLLAKQKTGVTKIAKKL